MMTELKPCPFCNGHAKINTKHKSAGMDGSYVNWIIYCEKCGAMLSRPADGFYGRKALTEDEAIESWNRRAMDGDMSKVY